LYKFEIEYQNLSKRNRSKTYKKLVLYIFFIGLKDILHIVN